MSFLFFVRFLSALLFISISGCSSRVEYLFWVQMVVCSNHIIPNSGKDIAFSRQEHEFDSHKGCFFFFFEFKFVSLMIKMMSRILALNERCKYALHM